MRPFAERPPARLEEVSVSADEARAEPGQHAPGAASGDPSAEAPASQRAITLKAILAGFAGIAVVGLYSNLNDRVLKLSPLVGNHMPIGAFTLILLLAVVWNPLIGRLHERLRFGTRELAVVLGMMLICSWIPGSSFYRYFHYQVIQPWAEAKNHPQWQAQGTLSHLPDHLYPLAHDDGTDPARWPPGAPETKAQQKAYAAVYGSFVRGIPEGDKELKVSEAPYGAWMPVMWSWWPLALSMGVCLLAMIWLLHRQWSHHEQLAYPIASVATSLIERTGGRLTSDLFYKGLFWGGFLPVFGIHLINNLNAWFPTRVPAIPLNLWVFDHHRVFPVLDHVSDKFANWRIFFLVVGIAYFIPSEIALSMGVCTVVMTVVAAICYMQVGTSPSADDQSFTLAGAYIGYFLILAYTGRHYYVHVFARALWLRPADPEHRQQAIAGRVFLVAGAAFVWCLVACFHLDWFVAILYASSLLIYFLVFARIIAETGIPFLQANFETGWVLCHLFGFPAIGPGAAVMIIYLGGVLNPDARECITPYVANTVKVAENVGVRVPRLMLLAVIGMVAALVIGFGAQTYSLYAKGASNDNHALIRPGQMLDQATRGLTTLNETGLSDVSRDTTGLAKLSLVPKNIGNGRQLGWLAFGVAGVLLLALLRFRFAWWPLHPVVFLMWGTWTATLIWLSFLIGWAVKVAVVRFGGGATYQRLKPLFIGMIMGEIVVVTSSLIVGFIYYASTGQLPKSVAVFPG